MSELLLDSMSFVNWIRDKFECNPGLRTNKAILGLCPEHCSGIAFLYTFSAWNMPVPDRKRSLLQSKLHKCCILCRHNMHFIAVAHYIKHTTSEITVTTRYIDVQMCSTPHCSVILSGSVCLTSYSWTDRTGSGQLCRVTRVLFCMSRTFRTGIRA
jgi:hypothetical protein